MTHLLWAYSVFILMSLSLKASPSCFHHIPTVFRYDVHWLSGHWYIVSVVSLSTSVECCEITQFPFISSPKNENPPISQATDDGFLSAQNTVGVNMSGNSIQNISIVVSSKWSLSHDTQICLDTLSSCCSCVQVIRKELLIFVHIRKRTGTQLSHVLTRSAAVHILG